MFSGSPATRSHGRIHEVKLQADRLTNWVLKGKDLSSTKPESGSSLEHHFPITQENVQASFDAIFAPWIKAMGLTDLQVSQGFCSLRLPFSGHLKFSSGAVCGQAMMSAIDTAASMAAGTTDRVPRGTVYQHTHFLRPAIGGDFLVTAQVKRFGKSSIYLDCSIVTEETGALVAHAVLEFAV